jgi:hypothetical protein
LKISEILIATSPRAAISFTGGIDNFMNKVGSDQYDLARDLDSKFIAKGTDQAGMIPIEGLIFTSFHHRSIK